MSDDDLELVHGSGNVFRDLGLPNPDLEQARAVLAAQIVRVLDERKLTVRMAETLTGLPAGDFSRIRHAKLERFTVDRMITVLGRLDQDVRLSVSVSPRRADAAAAA